MDYSKLIRTCSDWTGSRREAQAPKSVPAQRSVLDSIDLRGRIADSEEEKTQTKVMIIDDTQIRRIMDAPRDERRKVLSRLTDSQRRRLLARYRELTRVKDDASVDKLNYVNLDGILNDCVYVPDAYHLDLLDQWTSQFTVPEEIEGFVEAVRTNDRTALAANLDNYIEWCKENEIATEIEQAQDVIENTGGADAVSDATRAEVARLRAMKIKDEADKELDDETIEAIKQAAKSDVVTLEKSDKTQEDLTDYSVDAFVKQGYNYGKVSEVYNDAWNAAYKEQAADSSKKIATANKKLADAKKKIAELEARLKKVSDEAKKVADSAKKISDLEAKLAERRIMDDVIDEIAQKPLLNQDGQEVKPAEDRPIMAVLSEALEAYANGDSELLDKLASTTLNGDNTADEEAPAEAPVEESVEEPMEEPAEEESEENVEGDEFGVSEATPEEEEEDEEEEEKLGDSVNSSKPFSRGDKVMLYGDEPSVVVKDEDPENDKICLTNPKVFGTAEEGKYSDWYSKKDVTAKVGDTAITVECPIEKAEAAAKAEEARDKELAKELAQLLKSVEKGTECGEVKDSLNALIDSLSDKVPALKKYNFKVSDCAPVITACEPCTSINPPLSRSEYYDMCPVCPDFFDLVCAQYDCPQCPCCNEYEVMSNGVCVNPGPTAQMYYPCNCGLQEIADLLKDSAPEDYTKVINEHCIPMSDALNLAALTNNLGFIDNTFYKKHVGDSEWVFDSVPACLRKYTDKPGSIKLVAKASDSSINLFGQNFELR